MIILEVCPHSLDWIMTCMWASQLLTIQTTDPTIEMTFDFRNTPGFIEVGKVEVVMFNCPQWGVGVNTIRLLQVGTVIGSANPPSPPVTP